MYGRQRLDNNPKLGAIQERRGAIIETKSNLASSVYYKKGSLDLFPTSNFKDGDNSSTSSNGEATLEKNLEDQLTDEKLKQLQNIFEEADEDGGGGLDMDEFRTAMRRAMGNDLTDYELDIMFMKVDTNCDGTVDWDEYLSYMLLEYKEKDTMNMTSKPKTLPHSMVKVPNMNHYMRHHDNIIRIAIQPCVVKNSDNGLYKKSEDAAGGRYLTITKEGVVNYWSLDLKHLRNHHISNKKSYKGKIHIWVTDFVPLPTVNMVAVATTFSTITFYELTPNHFNEILVIEDLETAVTCMDFWYNPSEPSDAMLCFGDVRGNLAALRFHSKDKMNFLQPLEKGFQERVSFKSMLEHPHNGVTAHKIPGVHEDMVIRVSYIHALNCVMSCCRGGKTSLFQGDFERKKAVYFKVRKGVSDFTYCQAHNIIVTGGKDSMVRVWNPYVQTKPVMLLGGHNSPILFVTVSYLKEQIISFSEDREVKVFDMSTQTCIQSILRKWIAVGPRPISAVFFNESRQALVIGNNQLALFEHSADTDSKISLMSHAGEVTVVLYNDLFEQIVSAGTDSLVCVWNTKNGDKIIQFCAHGTTELGKTRGVGITSMCFDDTQRRLVTTSLNGSIRIWNFNNGALLRELPACDNKEITSVLVTRHRILTAGWNGKIQCYADKSEKEEIQQWKKEHEEDILSLVCIPPGTIASSSYDGYINLWHTDTGHSYNQLNANLSTMPLFGRFSAKEKMANQHRGDLSANHNIDSRLIKGSHERAVEKLLCLETRRIKPDCAILVASVANGWLHFWSIHPNGGLIGQFNGSHRPNNLNTIVSMCTDKINSVLITGDNIGYVKVWQISDFCQGEQEIRRRLMMRSRNESLQNQYDEQTALRKRSKRYSTFGSIIKPPPKEGGLNSKKFPYSDLCAQLRRKNEAQDLFPRPPEVTDPDSTWRAPPLVNSFRAHLKCITSIIYIDKREQLITASSDCSIRLWSVYGQFYGVFGAESPWLGVAATIEVEPQSPKQHRGRRQKKRAIPIDIKASGSATTLQVIQGGGSQWIKTKNVVMVWMPLLGGIKHKKKLQPICQPTSTDANLRLGDKTTIHSKSDILGSSYKKQRKHRILPRLPQIRQFNNLCGAYSTLPYYNLADDTAFPSLSMPQCLVELRARQHWMNATSERPKGHMKPTLRMAKMRGARRSVSQSKIKARKQSDWSGPVRAKARPPSPEASETSSSTSDTGEK